MNQYIAKDKLHDQTFLWKWNDADHTVVPPTKTEKKGKMKFARKGLYFSIFLYYYINIKRIRLSPATLQFCEAPHTHQTISPTVANTSKCNNNLIPQLLFFFTGEISYRND